jgi:hypothetical protein
MPGILSEGSTAGADSRYAHAEGADLNTEMSWISVSQTTPVATNAGSAARGNVRRRSGFVHVDKCHVILERDLGSKTAGAIGVFQKRSSERGSTHAQ